MKSGPLVGVRIVEFGGIGPGPMCAMLLADLGADIIRIDRPSPHGLGTPRPDRFNILKRNRPSVGIDLKCAQGVELALSLIDTADALIDVYRPGTMERMGLGPGICIERNPKLVYGRMTGWGQDGPLAQAAGHDINYIALSGVLHSIGREGQPPTPPLVLTGDFGGGAMYLALGILSGIIEARSSGRGQVVDASMVDGSALLMTDYYGRRAAGLHNDERGTNVTDGGAWYFNTYRCSDGKYVSIAPVESKFRDELLRMLGLDRRKPGLDEITDREAREAVQSVFITRTREDWCALLEGTDACFAPVLDLGEAPLHPHNRARGTFVEVDGVVQPAPAPRFSRTPSNVPTKPDVPGQSTSTALAEWGIDPARIDALARDGVIGARPA
ncbi:CaiB/BaiF CoA transferase family protein [Caenimonas aquaedulcis]|uniref:CoA transferase n=1 Tax=Caenimonas aquaedulcis TaxID=2793270 RepID=A0A931MJ29_9BURK|nr:CaiB/BaiF CoA-transferase family protein [Caenimonas aquaedulcis]MBG9390469.1 CoA transferase [Caenimonas aquaedulcis]